MPPMARTLPVLDPWTPLSFKSHIGVSDAPKRNLAPDWVGESHRRRLAAYMVLQAFIDNAAKWFMPEVDDDRREYGDVALFRNQILAALIGKDYSLVTDKAQDPISAVKRLEQLLAGETPTKPAVDPTTALPVPGPEQPIEISDEEKQRALETQAAQEFQTWIRDWAKKQRFNMKMVECERNSVGLGDGVYTLGYSPRNKKLRLRVFDPMFYFPELTDENDDEFPDVVHFCWEVVEDSRPESTTKLRRITYRMVPLERPRPTKYGETEEWTCLMSDGVWEINDHAPTAKDLTTESAQWATYTDPRTGEEIEFHDVDLGIGFMPVLHVPNTIAGSAHFGTSSIAHITQIFEDLSLNDTDLQASSATTGKPPVVLKGGRLNGKAPSYKAGEVWEVDAQGGLDILDTSRSLDVLLKQNKSLLERLSTNGRLPAVALGRAKLDQQIAGISLRLMFGPMESMVQEMRQVRDEKYDLFFKMVWRMCRQYGIEGTPDRFFDTHLRLGNFIPADQSSTVTQVVQLVERSAISLETGVLMLMEAGIPISDVAEEVLRIQSRDFKGANLLLDATGDQAGVYEYLSRVMPKFMAPMPGGAQRFNSGDPTVTDPTGEQGSQRGVHAQGDRASGTPAPTETPAPGDPGAPAGPAPAGHTWVAGYYQARQ